MGAGPGRPEAMAVAKWELTGLTVLGPLCCSALWEGRPGGWDHTLLLPDAADTCWPLGLSAVYPPSQGARRF